ncbi:hypothetical protein BYT27DRAFT_7250375 [Phlegmacium glaucopus]|nr:hypothetical protein BYT27DRAFT_7250375 [Phlegmacium glaucopus]
MFSNIKHLYKKLDKPQKEKHTSLTTTDALGSSPEVATLTLTAIMSITDLMPYVTTSAAAESAQAAHELQVSVPVSALAEINDIACTGHELQVSVAPAAYLEEISLSSPDTITQANLGPTESEQNPWVLLSVEIANAL